MEDIAKAIIEKTNNDDERKALLLSALADRYGTKKDNKYAMNSLGELYSKVKTSKPHSKEWYEAMNNYDEASKIYRTVIGDDGIDYYDAEIEKERMTPNTNEEKLEDMKKSSKEPKYEVVNDSAIDAIKDNFTPPGAKIGVDNEYIEYSEKPKALTKDHIEKYGEEMLKKLGASDEQIAEAKKNIDTNDNGKIEEDEMVDFQKSLDDYASKNKKGRDDIPVTTRR